ncbi:hypothetical protein [Variovorax arabinosiphilus]|uniref:hypothetical protein n=1 Tax=Variovorax arabinosiphilus TaxID=3053498 RepID=UPI0025757E7F|nr:hypothetical protein [Variovorax sp. J2L1-63]MDM0130704.1 hypothetical protein [Variovorax sp. J2L1-63]
MFFGRQPGERAQIRIAGLGAVACQVGTKGIDETQLERRTGARCTSERRSVSIEGRNRAQPGAVDPQEMLSRHGPSQKNRWMGKNHIPTFFLLRLALDVGRTLAS